MQTRLLQFRSEHLHFEARHFSGVVFHDCSHRAHVVPRDQKQGVPLAPVLLHDGARTGLHKASVPARWRGGHLSDHLGVLPLVHERDTSRAARNSHSAAK